MELVGQICELLKCLGAPTRRYIDDQRKFKERINDLKRRVDDLNDLKGDLESRIREELQWGKILKKQVKKWKEDVENINGEQEKILQRVPNVPWLSRARIGKRAARVAVEVQKLIDGGGFPEGVVTDDPSNTGVGFQLERLDVMQKIWNFLVGDEFSMIGVCGMGGIGKTTVMKHIHNKLLTESKDLFDTVIWVTVSKELNITKLQKEIATALKIVTFPESERGRVAALMDELGKRRYVLILDDVWERFSLLDVGIPKPTCSNGSKLVLTSRSIDVCKSMDCEIVNVRPLSEEESMNLFLEHVGREVLKDPSLKEIVQECDGLPLAITVIAGSMKGIYDVHEWRNSLAELREHLRSVKGTDTEIYERLKFSYDRLGDSNIQNCFLYCSLYPEDRSISRMELIEYWIDEGFLGSGRRQQLYDRGHTILNRLERNCLLEKDGDGGNVKMRDVVRDTALYIKDRSCFMVKAGLGLKELPSQQEWTEGLEKVSLMENSISEIDPNLSPECEHLSTLLLRDNRDLEGIPESFFEHMHRLGILDLSYTNIEQLPNSVSNLEKLNALVLRGCEKLRFVPSLEKLKTLRKLDLCDTAIEKVPNGLELLANLTYLNLHAKSLKELQISILSKLSCLQFLVFYLGPRSLNLKGLEAARLRKLEIFEGRFHELTDFNAYSESIQGQNLTSYLLVLASPAFMFDVRPEEAEDAYFIRKFKFMCNGAYSDEISALEMFITLNEHEGEALKRMSLSRMGDKRLLSVGGKWDLDFDPVKMEKNLEKFGQYRFMYAHHVLQLRHQPKKEVILHGDGIGSEGRVVLPSDLRCLRLFECHNLRSLSDTSFIQPENELKACSIHNCRGIEYVLDLSSSSCNPPRNLELLWLQNLDDLHVLVKLGEASRPVVSTSSRSQPLPAGIFSLLKSLRIEGCSNLKQVFPFELARNLHNLEELVVRKCGQMEEIVGLEQEDENQKGKGACSPTMKFKFSLPNLKLLQLDRLGELKRICSSNGIMVCESLREITVLGCPKLERMALHLPLFEDSGQSPSHPFEISIDSMEWWDSVEWEYPSAKNILKPRLK